MKNRIKYYIKYLDIKISDLSVYMNLSRVTINNDIKNENISIEKAKKYIEVFQKISLEKTKNMLIYISLDDFFY